MKLGIDVGSTTVKLVLLNEQDEILYQKYERHMSSVFDKVRDLLIQMQQEMGEMDVQDVYKRQLPSSSKAVCCFGSCTAGKGKKQFDEKTGAVRASGRLAPVFFYSGNIAMRYFRDHDKNTLRRVAHA